MSKSYRLIPLTQGQWAIVDAADYAYLNQWRWFAQWSPLTKSYYARRHVREEKSKKSTPVAMQVDLLKPPKGYKCDHLNCDTLDNRRCNLRAVTHRENARNRKPKSSGWWGVYLNKKNGKYRATIQGDDGKPIFLGEFANELDAIKARKKAETKYYGRKPRAPKRLKINPPVEIDRPLSVRNTSGFENVVAMKERWNARIVIKGKPYSLGVYDTPEEANEVYLAAKSRAATNPRYRPHIKPSARNTSGARGVSWHEASKKWRATTTVKNESGKKKHIHIGAFSKKRDAVAAWKKYKEEVA